MKAGRELIEAARGVLKYLKIPGESEFCSGVYLTPAQQLRVRADEIEAQERAILRFRAALKAAGNE